MENLLNIIWNKKGKNVINVQIKFIFIYEGVLFDTDFFEVTKYLAELKILNRYDGSRGATYVTLNDQIYEHISKEKCFRLDDYIKNDEKKIVDSFSYYVEFGTGGMRGTMGVGPNKINIFTIRTTISIII